MGAISSGKLEFVGTDFLIHSSKMASVKAWITYRERDSYVTVKHCCIVCTEIWPTTNSLHYLTWQSNTWTDRQPHHNSTFSFRQPKLFTLTWDLTHSPTGCYSMKSSRMNSLNCIVSDFQIYFVFYTGMLLKAMTSQMARQSLTPQWTTCTTWSTPSSVEPALGLTLQPMTPSFW